MTHFRSFRNSDSPALAALWNRGVPRAAAARALTGHEFDAHVVAKPNFEAAGLTVAERGGRIVGFAHAGFGPADPVGPAHQLCYDLGTIAMLVIEPGLDDPELEHGLIGESERYLRQRGAKVLYAGGQFPLNPFYWGIYGGSEWAGILSAHLGFQRAVGRAGYAPVSTTVLLELNLSTPEIRDPRAPIMRRQVRLDVAEDVMPTHWWEALAIGAFRPTQFQLFAKADNASLAAATTWDMSWYGREDGQTRLGLIAMEVSDSFRRKGYGRHLVAEILRRARAELFSVVAVQTRATNAAALALYNSLGFNPVETSVLYRLSGDRAFESGSSLALRTE